MRTPLLAILLGAGLSLSATALRAEDAPKAEKTVTGVLICNHCGTGMMDKDNPEASAAKHPTACSSKASCAASGYRVITGKAAIQLDDASAKKAQEYLSKTDNPRVTVAGTETSDGKLTVATIEPAATAQK